MRQPQRTEPEDERGPDTPQNSPRTALGLFRGLLFAVPLALLLWGLLFLAWWVLRHL